MKNILVIITRLLVLPTLLSFFLAFSLLLYAIIPNWLFGWKQTTILAFLLISLLSLYLGFLFGKWAWRGAQSVNLSNYLLMYFVIALHFSLYSVLPIAVIIAGWPTGSGFSKNFSSDAPEYCNALFTEPYIYYGRNHSLMQGRMWNYYCKGTLQSKTCSVSDGSVKVNCSDFGYDPNNTCYFDLSQLPGSEIERRLTAVSANCETGSIFISLDTFRGVNDELDKAAGLSYF